MNRLDQLMELTRWNQIQSAMEKAMLPAGTQFLGAINRFQVLLDLCMNAILICLVLQIACSIGMYGIFALLDVDKKLAVLPLINVIQLGKVCGRPVSGFLLALSKLGFLLVADQLFLLCFEWGPSPYGPIMASHILIAAAVLFVLRTLSGLRLFPPLCRDLGLGWSSVILFALLPNACILYCGIVSRTITKK